MSNTAQGSPDGPRFIYGRKNVNWQGPQQAAQGSFSADAMEDFATAHIASNPLSLVNRDDALHDTIERYSDNIALQSIQAPQTQHEIHDAIMQLHEKHLLEAVDDEGSTLCRCISSISIFFWYEEKVFTITAELSTIVHRCSSSAS